MIPNTLTWDSIEETLLPLWREVRDRGGSFSDAPFEPGDSMEDVMTPMHPLERMAGDAVRAWIETGELPRVAPAANRHIDLMVICGLGFIRRLDAIGSVGPPAEWTLQRSLTWVLFDVFADTVQVALDHMRLDLLGVDA
jgi:hypothetical protein